MFRRKKKTQKLTPQNSAPSGPAGGAPPSAGNVVQAVSSLKTTQGKLEKRIEFLRKKANRHLALAKTANANGNKQDALMNLKRKKVFEKEIGTLESSVLTIEENILRIEGSSAVADVYGALQLAKNTMKVVTRGVDAEKLQDLMGDIEDLQADQDEIQEILGTPAEDALADPDLEAELAQLGAEQLETDIFGTEKEENLEDLRLLKELSTSARELDELNNLIVPREKPVIKPVTQPTKNKVAMSAEDEELAALEAAMAI